MNTAGGAGNLVSSAHVMAVLVRVMREALGQQEGELSSIKDLGEFEALCKCAIEGQAVGATA